MAEIRIRELKPDDYSAIIAFWQQTPGCLFVLANNSQGEEFWKKSGFEKRADIHIYSKSLLKESYLCR